MPTSRDEQPEDQEARYDHHAVERKWQQTWEETGIYHVDLDGAARPYLNLMEFPYPSGEGLHVGHVYTYGGADVHGRYQRMRGLDVFQPMGFDAFGIHGENYALRLGVNPAILVPKNIVRFREEQMKRIGVAFNWERQVDTTDPDYYRWTQWIFLRLYHAGLAYRAEAPVNWCPSCLTTLADEQVIDGECERCSSPVATRRLTQWFFRITDYADRLLDFSKGDYPDVTRKLQTAWIGRREGTELRLAVQGGGEITVFTTRVDTLHGATFLVLAPEHPDVKRLTSADRMAEVTAYCEETSGRTPAERLATGRAKTGVFTGSLATNPINGRALPIWVADYVLAEYGTGAVFATPAHDARDLEFALGHGLPVIEVVAPPQPLPEDERPPRAAYEGEGMLINSGEHTGLSTAEGRRAITEDLAARGLGGFRVTYRLRDWLISRQRYWGPPIPIVYCERCGTVPVPEEDLPVLLPRTEHFRPLGTGESPLASLPEFVATRCPRCGGPARRETDVSDNFLDSAWYYLRYTSTEYHDRAWDEGRLRRWLPVSQYTGGVEHSTLHHLYARFLWKALQDVGCLPRDLGAEPFARLRLHGVVLKDGERMSKSRGTVVNPDEYVARYGADVLRVYLLFMGPFERGGDFRDDGINGVVRWLQNLWRVTAPRVAPPADEAPGAEEMLPLRRALHRAIRKVTDDVESMAFNTAIAELMAFTNTLREWRDRAEVKSWDEAVSALTRLVAPLAPHLAEELWARQGQPYSVHRQPWPEFDPALIEASRVTLAVQVNGRLRGRVEAPAGLEEAEAVRLALGLEGVQNALAGRTVQRTIVVPDRIVNLVV